MSLPKFFVFRKRKGGTMSIFVTFYLVIQGDLDFVEIEKLLHLRPSVKIRKNEYVYSNYRAEQDIWYYRISRKAKSIKKISDIICDEWKILSPDLFSNRAGLKQLTEKGLKLNLTVNCNCAKVGFHIPAQIISDIATLEIPFEVEYFSFS